MLGPLAPRTYSQPILLWAAAMNFSIRVSFLGVAVAFLVGFGVGVFLPLVFAVVLELVFLVAVGLGVGSAASVIAGLRLGYALIVGDGLFLQLPGAR